MLDSSLCPSCFGPATPQEICAQCGYNPKKPIKAEALAPGIPLAERYVVGGLLGQGGFGATYRGYDERLASVVAIKEFFPIGCVTRNTDGLSVSVSAPAQETFELVRGKFLEEARTLAKLRSVPGVVSVFDFFEANNTAYIIMEFLSGMTLKQLQSRYKDQRIPLQTALPIFLDVLSVLSDIHERAILHRDISPDNIQIDSKRAIKLLDFGAARQALSVADQRMTVILKPGYAPLEQYSEKSNHGPWSDLYAAGATFYMMLSGQKPPASLDRLMKDDLKSLNEMGIKVPAPIDRAILKALAVQPTGRWQTAAAFAEDLGGPSAGAVAEARAPLPEPSGEPVRPAAPVTVSGHTAAIRDPADVTGLRSQTLRPAAMTLDERIGQPISIVELKKLLEEHAKFLAGKPNGRRLNLSMRSLRGIKLGTINLSGAELTGTDFSRCNLAGANFTGANLFCADLSGANLTRAIFTKCDLRGARFDAADLAGASFESADCREGIMLVQRKDGQLRDVKEESAKRVASFANARMAGAVLCNANLGSANFVKADLDRADFGGADLNSADLGGAILKNARFEKAILRNCDFTEADLEGVDTNAGEFREAKVVRHLHDIEEGLQQKIIDHQKWVESLSHAGKRLVLKGGDISGLQMVGVDWSAAELLSVNMTDINLRQAKISMTDFSGSTLQGATLAAADARGAKFVSGNLERADFTGASLSPVVSAHGHKWGSSFRKSRLGGAIFAAADCQSVDFREADLRNANFQRAILRNANFSGALLAGADFTGADLSAAILPEPHPTRDQPS